MSEIKIFLIGVAIGYTLGFLVTIFLFSILSINTKEEEKTHKKNNVKENKHGNNTTKS